MKQLFLCDFENETNKCLIDRIVDEYKVDKEEVTKYHILIAYQSEGDWGCDSSSWFLLKDNDENLFEVSGGHCSCYGFEGQWEPQESSWAYLLSDKFYFNSGGYDDQRDLSKELIAKFIKENAPKRKRSKLNDKSVV